MCGIVGIWEQRGARAAELEARLVPMREALAHRGPDGAGLWTDEAAQLALGHRRLAIVDLSTDGAQPMTSPSGRYVVVFNGEIYNFRELRAELAERAPNVVIQGTSDTAVLVAALDVWGLERSLERFVGMFAFAVWDREDRSLRLVRDRLGIKPLYVARLRTGGIAFASELGAIAAHPGFSRTADRDALASYLRYNCVPAPHTGFADAIKVRPGTFLTLRTPDLSEARETAYWDPVAIVERAQAHPFLGDEAEAGQEVERLLREAVRLRLIADVPVGAFLSGGIDSSTVVALMTEESSSVRTFTIASDSVSYDEGDDAARVARHLGTRHETLLVSEADALAAVERVPGMLDEPFGDSSIIPTYLVSAMAKRRVTVALSGDGGDELFGGYNRHVWGPPMWRASRVAPGPVRRGLAHMLARLPASRIDRLGERFGRHSVRLPGQQAQKLGRFLAVDSEEDLYLALRSHWTSPLSIVQGAQREVPAWPGANPPALKTQAERMMFADMVSYLPDDILSKVDRASMAVALEARVPLIDHRVVAFAWSLPERMKIRHLTGKRVLRRLLARRVPAELVDRPKAGFGIPMAAWLRGPLRDHLLDRLSPERVRRAGLVDPEAVEATVARHLANRADEHHALWDMLALHAWAERFGVT